MTEILIIEDDGSVRELLTLALEAEHYKVRTAASGPEGLARWRSVRPDLILLDVMLPGADGFEVYEADELHALTAAFNEMADSLERSTGDVRAREEAQRQFV